MRKRKEELYGYEFDESTDTLTKEKDGQRLKVRKLSEAHELAPYVGLLNGIWGFPDKEALPLHEYVVSVKTGGLFLAVELDGEAAGLVQVAPAWTREWGFHHHSNFMGFLPGLRAKGLGLEAKRAHVIFARRDGVGLVTWTFDPAQALNANLNFRKLGATCGTYLPDLYGSMGGEFDAGLASDRLLVEWRIDSDLVRERLSGKAPTDEEVSCEFRDDPAVIVERFGMYITGNPREGITGKMLVAIPSEVHDLAKENKRAAEGMLIEFRELMRTLFGKGYKVVGSVRAGVRDGHAWYALTKGA